MLQNAKAMSSRWCDLPACVLVIHVPAEKDRCGTFFNSGKTDLSESFYPPKPDQVKIHKNSNTGLSDCSPLLCKQTVFYLFFCCGLTLRETSSIAANENVSEAAVRKQAAQCPNQEKSVGITSSGEKKYLNTPAAHPMYNPTKPAFSVLGGSRNAQKLSTVFQLWSPNEVTK